jgi:anti-repressor protein
MSEYSLQDPNQGIFESQTIDWSLIEVKDGKVDARGLHQFLEVETKFADWVARQLVDFEEGFDFLKNEKPIGIKQNGQIDYLLTVDTAKELAMLSRTERGRQARKYFIEMEKKAKEQASQPALPYNYISALEQLLESKKEEQRLRLEAEANKDKVEFADQLLDTTNAIDFKTAAKAMHLDFGRNTLFAKCRELGLIDRNNQPYQEFIDRGYFVLIETSYLHPKTGDRILTTKTLVTAKGQQFLLKKLGK